MKNNLAWKYVKSTPRRSVLTVFGIAMALAMMMCIGNAISTVLGVSQKQMAKMYGSWDTMFFDMDESTTIDSLKSESNVDDVVGIYENSNFVIPKLRDEDLTEEEWLMNNSYSTFVSADETATTMMNMNLAEGSFPKDATEVVISSHMAELLEAKLGDTIHMETGSIEVMEDFDDETGDFIIDASFDKEARTVKVSGIMAEEDNQGLFRGNLVIVAGPMAKAPTSFMVKFAKGTNVVTASEQLADKYNGMLAVSEAVYTRSFSSLMAQMFMVGVIFIFCCCLIAFAAISIVRNSFSMSVTERMRDYGLLRCAGATKKQIKSLIRSEVFILLAMAFPLSLIISYVASVGVLALVNNMDLMGMPQFDLTVSWFFILLSLGIALVSMIIAVVGPSRKASSVSPIMITTGQDQAEGMMNKAVAKKSKVGRMIGVEWELATRNRRAAGKRSRTTVFSMTVSVMLMIATMGMMQTYLLPEMRQAESEIDIIARGFQYDQSEDDALGDSEFEEYCAKSAKLDGVTQSAMLREVWLSLDIDESQLADKTLVDDIYGLYEGKFTTAIRVKYIGRDEYKQLQQANGDLAGLSYDQWLESGGGLLNDNIVSAKTNQYGRTLKTARHKLFNLQGAGQLEVELLSQPEEIAYASGENEVTSIHKYNEDDIVATGMSFDISRSISNRVWFDDYASSYENSVIYMPEERWEEQKSLYKEYSNYSEYNFFAKTSPEKNEAVAEAMEDASENIYVGNLYREELVIRNIVLLISICVYSFVGVIALISCLNIINIIGTNLVLRKRDFGLLQAVGMNVSQMRKMIVFECIQFSLRSMLYGSILGFAALAALHAVLISSASVSFYINPWTVLGIFVACFMVSIIASWPTWKKMKKVSIMESIRHIG